MTKEMTMQTIYTTRNRGNPIPHLKPKGIVTSFPDTVIYQDLETLALAPHNPTSRFQYQVPYNVQFRLEQYYPLHSREVVAAPINFWGSYLRVTLLGQRPARFYPSETIINSVNVFNVFSTPDRVYTFPPSTLLEWVTFDSSTGGTVRYRLMFSGREISL